MHKYNSYKIRIYRLCLFFIFLTGCNALIAQNTYFNKYKPELLFSENVADVYSWNKDLKYTGYNYDLKYLRFNLFIDPDTLYLKGSVTSYFLCSEDINKVSFELDDNLTVDSVLFKNIKIPFNHFSSDELEVDLPQQLPQGALDSLTVYYKGSPSAGTGFGSFMKNYHNGIPIIWTLSEPYGAKDWWPCKNDLSDKIDSVDIIISSPFPYRSASNGMLIYEHTNSGITMAYWKHRYPIAAYLIAVAVTNYNDYSDYVHSGNDSLQILNYVFPEYLSSAQVKSPAIIPVMELFDSLFIPYPFSDERYGHAQFLWGGGMEHQTMTFISDFEFGIMAHELAHSWFGNYITCGSWHHIWLNEGFATYLTGLAYEHLFNGYWWPQWKKMTIQHVLSQPDGSVFCYDTSSVFRVFDSRLSYNKGSLVLHQLRWVIGDSAFFAGLRNYLNSPQLAYSYAYSDDFINIMENAADTSLTEFFNDWLYGEGYPVYDVHCDILNGSQVQVLINQTTSDNSVDLFEMPLPLRFKNSFADTVVRLINTSASQNWIVDLGFIPDSVFFDPEMWLVAKVNSLTIGIPDATVNDENLLVSPNPVNDILLVKHKSREITGISLVNSSGAEYKVCQNIVPANEIYQINMNVFPPGLWLVKIITAEGIIIKKVVKK